MYKNVIYMTTAAVVQSKEGNETTVKQNFCNEIKLVLILTRLFQVKMLITITSATIKKVSQKYSKRSSKGIEMVH